MTDHGDVGLGADDLSSRAATVAEPGEWWRYSQAYMSWPAITVRDPQPRPAPSIPMPARMRSSAAFALASFIVAGTLTCIAAVFVASELSMPLKVATGLLVAATISVLMGCSVYLPRLARCTSTISGRRLEALDPRLRGSVATALLALADIEGSRAFREQFLGELDIAAARWQVVRDAVAADELLTLHEATEPTALDDEQALTEAQTAVEQVIANLGQNAEALVRAALAARELSAELDDSAARSQAELARERLHANGETKQQRLRAAMAAVTAAGTATPESTDLSEAVDARVRAYAELARDPLGGPAQPQLDY